MTGGSKLNKKLQVFVSSTFLDLKSERQKAVEGILRSKHIPAGMELFIPSDKTQWEIIKEWIKDSDLLLLILGGRYGSIEPESGKSYTQLEYEFAISNNIPVFAIVLNDQFLANKKSQNIQLKVYEHEVDNPSLEKYKSFKAMVMENLVSLVEDINQISTEVSLALHEFISKDDTEYKFRGWVRGKERLSSKDMSIENTIQNYIDEKEREGLVKDTLDNYKANLRIFQKYFVNFDLDEIDTAKIKEFLRYREDSYSINSKSTMEVIRGILKVFFDWLVQEKIIENNPVNKVKPYKYKKKGNEGLNDTELKEIRDACVTSRERALVEMLLSTGCHLSEIGEIHLNDVNWSNKTININSTKRQRVVFLTPKAEKYLKIYLDERDDKVNNLFVTERKPYRPMGRRAIERVIDKIEIRTNLYKSVTPRTFRDTFVRLMLEQGFQWNNLQVLLGYHPTSSRSESLFKITNTNIWDIMKSRPDF
jgi:site-specific recombinase XerD